MTQVWLLDENKFFTGESKFVEEVEDNMTTEPLLVGYVKAKWTGREWIEGATEEEIKEWQDTQQKTGKTELETMKEQLTQLIIKQL